jgi:hypothetical protein
MKNVKEKVKALALPVSTAIMTAPATICAFAADVDLATITSDAMTQISGDLSMVIAAATAAAIGLVGITVGVSYLIKKAKALKDVG